MGEPIQVPEIGLRIAEAAWRGDRGGRPGLVSFVSQGNHLSSLFPKRADAEPSPTQSHLLALEYLGRFWTSDRMCTAVVTNISMGQAGPTFLVKPPMEASVTLGYGVEDGIPAFHCVVKNGFLLAIRFEYGRYSEEISPDDLILTGPVYVQAPPNVGEALSKTRPPLSLPPDAQQAILGLKSTRLPLARKLEDWQSFLNWQLDLVQRRQIGLHYHSAAIDSSSKSVQFDLQAPAGVWKQLRKIGAFAAIAMPAAASQDPQNWSPHDNARGICLGELLPREADITSLLGGDAESSTDDDRIIEGVVDFHPEEDFWDEPPAIAPAGFLVNAIHAGLVPLQRQQNALTKLIRGEHVNPRLPHFLFQADKARVPCGPILSPQTGPGLTYFHNLNRSQRHAVAKAMAAIDLFLVQGPPGTGKTVTLAEICWQAALAGQRVLVVSQSHLAVDNILGRLPDRPQLRPLRVGNGRERGQGRSPLSEDLVVGHWFSCIRGACKSMLDEGDRLTADCESVGRQRPRLESILVEYENLLRDRQAVGQRMEESEVRSSGLLSRLGELERQASAAAASIRLLENIYHELSTASACRDAGEWVQMIDQTHRPALFECLTSWRRLQPMPEAVSRLLSANTQTLQADVHPGTSARSRILGLGRKLRRWLADRQRPPELPKPPVNPNWAVEWIEALRLHNGLKTLRAGLPRLLASCEEAERLCAARGMSQRLDCDWAKATGDLHEALKIPGLPIAGVLGIAEIATSLRPQRQFRRALAAAREAVQEALVAVPPLADGLAGALIAVTRRARDYLAELLSQISDQVRQTQAALGELKQAHENSASGLAEIQADLSRLESDWRQIIASLPEGMRDRAGAEDLSLQRPTLSRLDAAGTSYLADSQVPLERHRRWGAIQAEWIRLLAQPTEADRQRLAPLYLKRCNVVGATCSCCGNRREFLGRPEFRTFDVVIVDEVSKATPPELLLAALPARKLILAGDFKQLPPTFKDGPRHERPFGEMAELDEEFEQVMRYKGLVTASLFKKLFQDAPEVLKQYFEEQYRMHPQIMEVINQFYDGRLRCGIEDPHVRCAHGLTVKGRRGELLSAGNHVLWVDTSYDDKGRAVRERQAGSSKANDLEARSVARVIGLLNNAARDSGKAPKSLDVAVITFYGAQLALIRRELGRLKGAEKDILDVRLDTVDNFQGAERSIVIVSLVRSKRGAVGEFAKTFERINVAMSRAQKLLIVLGAVNTFANLEVPLPSPDGAAAPRRCYAHILDVIKKYGGLRCARELF